MDPHENKPKCHKCHHPRTKKKGRPMVYQGAARHFDPTHYHYECNRCGRSRTVEGE